MDGSLKIEIQRDKLHATMVNEWCLNNNEIQRITKCTQYMSHHQIIKTQLAFNKLIFIM